MKVDKINFFLSKVKHYLRVNNNDEFLYKYECLKNFQENWDIDSTDLLTMYDHSFSSKISSRLWGGRQDSPKSAMLKMIAADKHFADAMFRDLFDEEKEVGPRMDRFFFHCDQLAEITSKDKKDLLHHKHDNHNIISVYLSFRYPEKYCIFEYPLFRKTMIKLEVQTVPQEFEISRFFKLSQALYKIISKDEELMKIQKKRIDNKTFYKDASLLIISDFYELVGGSQYMIERY